MKNLFVGILAICCLSFFSFTTITEWQAWSISKDYVIQFSGKGAAGNFNELQGTIVFNPDQLDQASMDVSVQTASIETGNSTKNKHARNSSWFDAEKYPTIRFVSKSFSQQGSGYVVNGDLTLHGVTKRIAIPFEFKQENGTARFVGDVTVNRKDYGIDGNMFGFMVGKDFKVSLNVPVQ